jgi:Ca2+-binding RTX toxin-like protein
MAIASSTADIHMINIALTAADGSGRVWQDPTQMIPMGMAGNPEGFVAGIKAGLPLVNNLRVMFNEYSFNPDGSMNPQFERFLAAAAAAGYQITLAYGSGDTQNIGIGDAAHPHLTNAQAYDALQDNFTKVQGAWDKMMDWMDGHQATKSAVYGWDLMNEPAAYRHTVRANGTDAAHDQADFVQLYASHIAELSQAVQARAEGHVLVGGWGYNGDFLTLGSTAMGSGSVVDYLRAAVGDALVWSGHFYPGWMGTNLVADPDGLIARLNTVFAPLLGDAVLITEMNVDGQVDDVGQAPDYGDLFASTLEWFAEAGMGLGWYPGLQTGASHLLTIESDGDLSLKHQHSFAHAMNAYSLGENPLAHAGDERLTSTLVDATLRNEAYEIAAGEATFDALTKFGTAFGFGGNDLLQGSVLANDFLYGGAGNDLIRSIGGDDFLFGQGGNDRLVGGTGIDHLFGGAGDDTLDGGLGADVLAGGAGNDSYYLQSQRETVREYAGGGTDTVYTAAGSYALSVWAEVENLVYLGAGNFTGSGNAAGNAMLGGQGHDTLSGADGRDTLAGQGGDDVLTGGTGGDRFVFGPELGQDRITDFGRFDTILFRNVAGVDTVADAMAHATQVGGTVVFDFGLDSLTVQGVTLAQLAGDVLVL